VEITARRRMRQVSDTRIPLPMVRKGLVAGDRKAPTALVVPFRLELVAAV
jgi:hypothetical protein